MCATDKKGQVKASVDNGLPDSLNAVLSTCT